MTVIIDSTAEIDGVRLREQGSDPSAPSASHWILYAKATGLFIEDSASAVTGPMGAGGGGSGTSLVIPMTNVTGSTANLGDVVVLADYTPSSFDLQTNLLRFAGDASYLLGVVVDATIANAAIGNICIGGYVAQVNLNASASSSAYQFLRAAYTTQEGEPVDAPSSSFSGPLGGSFGFALGGGTTPAAIIWNPPSPLVEKLIAIKRGINMNSSGGTTDLVYGITGLTFYCTRIVCKNASTSLTTASWSIGQNSTSFDDVIANATHTELTGNTLYTILLPKVGATELAVGGTLKLKVNTPQGSAATMDVDVYGYYI